MAGSEHIARGVVEIEVLDREALARLKALRAEYHRTMEAIDREDATATVKGDISDLKRKAKEARAELDRLSNDDTTVSIDGDLTDLTASLDEAKRKLKRLRAEKASVEVGADTKELDAQIKKVRAEILALDSEKAEVEVVVKDWKKAIAELKAVEKANESEVARREKANARRIAANDKLEASEARLAAASERRAAVAERRSERMVAAQLREQNAAEKAAARRAREVSEVPKLELAYQRLIDKLERLQSVRRKARGDDKALFHIDLEEKALNAELERLRSEVVRRVGREPIHLDIAPTFGERAGRAIRSELLRNNGNFMSTFAAVGARAGERMGANASRGFRRTMQRGVKAAALDISRDLGSTATRAGLGVVGKLGGALGNLSTATVRLGPFTTTVRGLIVSLSLLGPVLVDVVGALGSLVSVAGSAAVGVGALGAGLLGGAIPAALGFGLVIKGVVNDFQNVTKGQKAYNDAVLKYGKGSDQATKKMQELRHIMGGVSAETAKQYGQWQKLKDQWRTLSAPGRASVFTTLADGIKTANVLMGDFAKRTNEGMGIAQRATSRWMAALRSREGRNILDTMMGNFNKSLGPVLHGLGSLAAYLGRVGRIASGSLPGLARTFDSWAGSILDTSDNAGQLNAKIQNVIQSAKDVGNFFLSAGRLMKAFFSGGVSAGQGFVRTMSNAMDRWSQLLSTPQGQNNLNRFFTESVHGAQALYNTLAPIISSFVRWASEMAPFARAFFDGASAVSHLVGSLLQVTALRGPVTALVATLGSLWAVGKISRATQALSGFGAALGGISRSGAGVKGVVRDVERAAAVAGGTTFVPAGGLGAGRVISEGEKVAAAGSRMARGLNAAKVGAGGLITGLTGLSPVMGATVLGLGAISLAVYKSVTGTSDYEKGINEANKAQNNWLLSSQALPAAFTTQAQAVLQARGATLDLKSAQAEVTRLQKAGKKGTDEYAYAQLNLSNAQQQVGIAQQQVAASAKQSQAIQIKATRDAQKETKSAADAVKGLADRNTDAAKAASAIQDRMGRYGESLGTATKKVKELAKTQQGLFDNGGLKGVKSDDIDKAAGAIGRWSAAEKDLHRQQELSVIAELNRQRAVKGLVPVANAAARSFSQISRYSRGLSTKIALKFTGAEDAGRVAKSAAASLRSGVPKSVVTRIVGDASGAEEAIKRLQRVKLSNKTLKIIQSGGERAMAVLNDLVGKKLAPKVLKIIGNSADAAHKVAALIALGIPPKVARMLGDNHDALAKAAQANHTVLRDLVQRINRVLGAVDPSIYAAPPTLTQRVIQKRTGGAAAGQGPGMGQDKSTNITAARQSRAIDRAFKGQLPRATTAGLQRGAKVQGPRAIYGEEPQYPEFVISTNPSYRDSNMKYLHSAARQLGVSMKAAGGFSGSSYSAEIPDFKSAKSHPRPASKFKKKKRRNGVISQRRSWTGYIDHLSTSQDDWEREVSIREGAVREPDDWVVKDHDQPVLDSKGKPVLDESGKPVTTPIYAANPKIKSEYIPDMTSVTQAYEQLLSIIAELVRAIPLAQQAVAIEKQLRTNTVHSLDHNIDDMKKKVKHAKKQSTKESYRKELTKLIARRDKERGVIKDLGGDNKELGDRRKEAGFSYTEEQGAYFEAVNDRDTALGKYTNEANQQTLSEAGTNAGGAGGAGGGSTSDPGLSYGEQAVLADTERAQILKDFGSNFNPNVRPALNAASRPGAGQATVANPAQLASSTIGTMSNNIGVGVGQALASATAAASSGGAAAAMRTAAGNVAGAQGGGQAAPVSQTSNVTVNNSFGAPPPDPHTWSQGVQFELQAIV